MSKRRNLVGLCFVLAVMAVPTVAAAASAGLTIKPTKPIVDDNLIVSFKIDKQVPVGNSITAVVNGVGSCAASLAAKTLKGPKPAGKKVTLRFRPADQLVGPKGQWCQGRAKVRVTEAKGENFIRKLAETYFRFSRRP
jgi:hypothetical protein